MLKFTEAQVVTLLKNFETEVERLRDLADRGDDGAWNKILSLANSLFPPESAELSALKRGGVRRAFLTELASFGFTEYVSDTYRMLAVTDQSQVEYFVQSLMDACVEANVPLQMKGS